jgi:hypothetical protein
MACEGTAATQTDRPINIHLEFCKRLQLSLAAFKLNAECWRWRPLSKLRRFSLNHGTMTSLVSARSSVKPPDSRPGHTDIHQEGPQFGATHVSGGNSFQGNFVGLTISKLMRAADPAFNTDDVQTLRLDLTTAASFRTPRSSR